MSDQKMPPICNKHAYADVYYRGWDRAGKGYPCVPPPLLSEQMQAAYRAGHRARLAAGVGVAVSQSEAREGTGW